MFIANIDDGKIEYNTTYKKENTFSIKVKKLGKFLLAKDEVAPKFIAPILKKETNLDKQKTLKISISDDLSGIKEYNAYLNEKMDFNGVRNQTQID